MSDAALLIRCPTCKNLLSEPSGCSIFQCGGCGALLTAKKRHLNSLKETVGAVAETKDFVGGQGIVRVFPSKQLSNFSVVSKVRHIEINHNTEIGRNGMNCTEGKDKMHDCELINDLLMVTSSNFSEEGPSNYMYNYGRMSHVAAGTRKSYLEGSKRVEHLEQDRLELLRKLDELNNQLRHSGSLSKTTKEKGIVGRDLVHNETYGIADAWMANDCLDRDMRKPSKQTYLNDKSVGRPPYYANYPDSYPYTNQHEPYMQSSYRRLHSQDDGLKYGMCLESQMPRIPATSVSSQYAHLPNYPLYYPGQYIDADPDTFKPYHPNDPCHHPTCSCFQCYNIHHNEIPSDPRSNFPYRAYADMPINPLVYHYNYESRVTGGPSSFHDTRTSMRGIGDYKSGLGNYESQRTRRVVLSKGGSKCHPLLGGAPFVTCHNCFEVLQLPIKILNWKDRQNKLQCGACSTIICYFFKENKLLISEHSELKSESESSEVMDEGVLKSVGPVNQLDDKFNSVDFDTLSNDFKLFGEEHNQQDAFCNLNTNETYDTNLISTSPASPSNREGDGSQLNLKARINLRSSIAQPALREHLDYSSTNHLDNQDEKGNLSTESDHDRVISKTVITTNKSLLRELSVATEMEVSFNGYPNSGISQDSGNGSKEEQHQQIDRKDGFAGTIKKSFKDIIKLDQTNEVDKPCVTINGHPISDRMIKKASRRAGRVQPGNYWYDVRAGFWGVMGGPCLGIIPPFIEEFNYPLSEDCSGGTTCVFVNGRELHEKDLKLLSGRGLPTTQDRSYIIEISGRVLDADSGKELDSLGRLARTVEKAKHGFGMKVPKEIVENKNDQ